MSSRPKRRWGYGCSFYRSGILLTVALLAALGGWLIDLSLPTLPDAAAQGVVVNAVDQDTDNRLWDCAQRRVPFGNEDEDRLRCFTFRYQVPPGGVQAATLHVAIRPLGSLQDTDALVVAVGSPFPTCEWGQGEMAGCVPLHGGFRGGETSLNLNLLDVACDASVQGSPEAQQALLAQLQTGVLHFMLQDDTAVFGAQLVLNSDTPAFPCGTSEQPWVALPASSPAPESSLAATLSHLVTGTHDAQPPSPVAVAGAAVAATAGLGAYAALSGTVSRVGSGVQRGGSIQRDDRAAAAGAQPPNRQPRPEYAGLPQSAQPGDESDLREALDQFRDHLEDLAEPGSPTGPRLVVKAGRANKMAVAMTAHPVTIGRDASNTLTLYDPSVSRQHAVVKSESGAWVLSDLNSANGTSVNDNRVAQCVLRHGDQIRIGDVVLLFEDRGSAEWRCSHCGRSNPPTTAFCGHCGTRRQPGG